MPISHVVECLVTLLLAGKPVQPFPVVSKNLSYRVVGWQGDAYAKAALCASDRGIDQIVLMTKIQVLVSFAAGGAV